MNFNFLKNTKAISYTVGIHLLLLLIFFFVKYRSVALPPPPADELIELETVALGTDDNGFGVEPPEMMIGMPAPPTTPAGESSASANDISASAANQTETENDNEDHDDVTTVEHPTAAPVLRRSGGPTNPKPVEPVRKSSNTAKTDKKKDPIKNTTNRSNNTNTTRTANTRTSQPQAKYTFEGGNGPGGNGAEQNAPGSRNRGNGTGEGMMGRPGGDPNSLNFTGGISGRSIVARPDSKAEFRDGGSVRIKVWVNREGQITRYNILSAKNAAIRAIAEQKIKGVRFNKSPEAAAEQSGILTLNFKAGTGR